MSPGNYIIALNCKFLEHFFSKKMDKLQFKTGYARSARTKGDYSSEISRSTARFTK